MEETILSKDVRPGNNYAQWVDKDHYTAYDGSQWKFYDLGGKEGERPAAKPRPTLPKGAANITKSEGGAYAYTLGKSLYYIDSKGDTHTVAESGDDNITYGQTVSRNEFGINGGIQRRYRCGIHVVFRSQWENHLHADGSAL